MTNNLWHCKVTLDPICNRSVINMIFLVLVVVVRAAQACTVPTFDKSTIMTVTYSRKHFVSNANSEINYLQSDKRNMSVPGCVSYYTTTLVDSRHQGTVQQITIKNNDVPVLYQEAVSNFATIWLVELQNNKIKKVNRAAIFNLPQLDTLHLSNNEIEQIEDEALMEVAHLHSLFLEHNALKTFRKEWLGSLTELYVFNLAFNRIEKIPRGCFRTLSNLRILNLAHNRISYLHNMAFERLNYLEMLDLGYNKIKSIDNHPFLPTINLRVLNLYYNNLTYIPLEVFNNLKRLEDLIVLSNPITCKCYTEVLKWASKNSVDMKNSYLECKKVESVEDIPVCVVTNDARCATESADEVFGVLPTEWFDYECNMQSTVISLIQD